MVYVCVLTCYWKSVFTTLENLQYLAFSHHIFINSILIKSILSYCQGVNFCLHYSWWNTLRLKTFSARLKWRANDDDIVLIFVCSHFIIVLCYCIMETSHFSIYHFVKSMGFLNRFLVWLSSLFDTNSVYFHILFCDINTSVIPTCDFVKTFYLSWKMQFLTSS